MTVVELFWDNKWFKIEWEGKDPDVMILPDGKYLLLEHKNFRTSIIKELKVAQAAEQKK